MVKHFSSSYTRRQKQPRMEVNTMTVTLVCHSYEGDRDPIEIPLEDEVYEMMEQRCKELHLTIGEYLERLIHLHECPVEKRDLLVEKYATVDAYTAMIQDIAKRKEKTLAEIDAQLRRIL
jgi:hypothetical protein